MTASRSLRFFQYFVNGGKGNKWLVITLYKERYLGFPGICHINSVGPIKRAHYFGSICPDDCEAFSHRHLSMNGPIRVGMRCARQIKPNRSNFGSNTGPESAICSTTKSFSPGFRIIHSSDFYRTAHCLALVTHSLNSVVETWLMWPWRVKMLISHNISLLM